MEIPEEILRLVHRYLSGTATDDEKSALVEWLEASQSNREDFAALSAMRNASSALGGDDATDKMLSRLNARIDAEESGGIFTVQSVRGRRRKATWLAAASVAAALVIGAGTYRHFRTDADYFREYSAFTNISDDVSAMMLDDSTKVWLSRNSSILYGSTKGRSERIVKLTGEAYFDVHRDTLHPFVVKARGIEVKVLGTAFCVKSDSEAGKVSVLLERGSVRLQSPEGVGLVRLSPDQMAEFDAKTGDIEVTPMAAEPYIVQHYNKVTLQQVSIDGIISHIERMYGIKVQALSPVDTTKKYNLNYKRTDDAGELMEAVEELTGVRLKVIGKTLDKD